MLTTDASVGNASVVCCQVQIEDEIEAKRLEELVKLSEECSIALDDLDRTVKPIIDSCTKDAILVTLKFFWFQGS